MQTGTFNPRPEIKDECDSVEEMKRRAIDEAESRLELYDSVDDFIDVAVQNFREIAFSYLDTSLPKSQYDRWRDSIEDRCRTIWNAPSNRAAREDD